MNESLPGEVSVTPIMMLLSLVFLGWMFTSLVAWGWGITRLFQGGTLLRFEPRPRLSATLSDILLAIGVFGLTGALAAPLLLSRNATGPDAQSAATASVEDGSEQATEEEGAEESTIDDSSSDVGASKTEGLENVGENGIASDSTSSDSTVTEAAAREEGQETIELDPAALVPALLLQALATSVASLVALAWIRLRGFPLGWYGFLPRRWDVFVGLAGVVMVLPPTYVIQSTLIFFIEYSHPLIDVLSDRQSWDVVLAMVVCSSVVAPLTEEFFFRGLIQGWLQRLGRIGQDRQRGPIVATLVSESAENAGSLETGAEYDGESPSTVQVGQVEEAGEPSGVSTIRDGKEVPYWPIVVTSLLFALAHFGQGPAPVSLFFLSLGLGYLYRQTGRIWAGVFVHMFLNGLTTMMTLLVA